MKLEKWLSWGEHSFKPTLLGALVLVELSHVRFWLEADHSERELSGATDSRPNCMSARLEGRHMAACGRRHA